VRREHHAVVDALAAGEAEQATRLLHEHRCGAHAAFARFLGISSESD
jgi:DNA-binding GntR family transcriptional regulator